METINDIELRDENIYPDNEVLEGILGPSFGTYCELLRLFEAQNLYGEWRYYKDGKAWLCKVQFKKRTIVWMSAWKGYMQATVYIPLRLLDDLLDLGLSPETVKKISGTKNVGKSKPCIFEMRSSDLFSDFEKVMQYKITHK